MDSLLINKISELHSLQDTLIKHSNKLQTSIENLESENLWLKLLPFIGVIIGGVITYLGQNYLKNKEIKITAIKESRICLSKIFTNLTTLNFYLRRAAYLEVDSKFQYQLSCKGSGEKEKRALEEHYNDYKYISENRNKIAMAISEIHSSFIAYYKCIDKTIPPDYVTKLNTLYEHVLNLERHKEYPEELEITTDILNKDILTLKTEYTKNINPIINIANSL